MQCVLLNVGQLCNIVSAQDEYRGKSRFLYGESMGGAVALLLHKKDLAFWTGAVLVAPMCKVTTSACVDSH